jgi:exodeoxyribonuclease VII large subunit
MLDHGLKRNLQEHGRALVEIATLLRPRCVTRRIEAATERVKSTAHRLERCYGSRLRNWRDQLESSARLLESVSHRSVLERGFALVRGADGSLRRRAAEVKAGETLSLAFADSTVEAKAEGPASRGTGKPKAGQGNLF